MTRKNTLLSAIQKISDTSVHDELTLLIEKAYPEMIKKAKPTQGNIIMFTDGASKGNPGKSGAGWIIYDHQNLTLNRGRKYLGYKTNNQSEYLALFYGLEDAMRYNPKSLSLFLDSELVVKQIQGKYKVKNADLKPLHTKIINILSHVPFTIQHVPRDQNSEADALANEAISS
ncbi:ribonuclease H [Candidatus Peregrinibacteria bacterium]|nr:MAG: ribonuclease H [Candidatus Peregrinibacteria bacterium]